MGRPEAWRTILGLPIAKISFKKMKFNFSIGHSGRSEEARSWAAAGHLRLLAALGMTNRSSRAKLG
ncbi:MAG: hypothetical protein DMG82_01830 [Acidobacteria bacterium]|nr:MAG: hypothetical protein DMG82_01830 [Acidobacteriota bacterium]PYX48389.1 MAG: hypothetical protein DMG83_01660 [Acidobacteriota bacterium]